MRIKDIGVSLAKYWFDKNTSTKSDFITIFINSNEIFEDVEEYSEVRSKKKITNRVSGLGVVLLISLLIMVLNIAVWSVYYGSFDSKFVAMLCMLKNDYKEPDKNYELAEKQNPLDTDTMYERAQILINDNRFDSAMYMINKVIDIDKTNGKFYCTKGVIEYNENLFDDAIQSFNLSLQKKPDSLAAKCGLVLTYLAKGDILKAKGEVDGIIASNKNDPEVFFTYATVLFEMGDTQNAVLQIEKSIDLNKSNSKYWLLKADIYLNNNQQDKVQEQIEIAKGINPNNYYLYYISSKLFYVNNQFIKALDMVNKAIDLNPYFSSLYSMKALLISKTEGGTSYERYLDIALNLNPNNYFNKLLQLRGFGR